MRSKKILHRMVQLGQVELKKSWRPTSEEVKNIEQNKVEKLK